MTQRQKRGKELSEARTLTKKKRYWLVPSEHGKMVYTVSLAGDASTCTCLDFTRYGNKCKHIFAAEYVENKKNNLSKGSSVVEFPVVPQTKRKTYSQDWPIYNRAKENEAEVVKLLLSDLCNGIQVDTEHKMGRPSASLSDVVYCMVYKVYTKTQARHLRGHLKNLENDGYILQVPCRNTVLNYFGKSELTPLLQKLIVESSVPLVDIEKSFAADSTGFSTSRFDRWFSHKYGKEKIKADWVKGHIICGTKTHIIAGIEILGQYTHDATVFPDLLKAAQKNFEIKEVSADKAYLSESNLVAITDAGAMPFIPPKSNTKGRQGSAIRELYVRFMADQEGFLKQYHQRSNVEAVFSAIKRRFGDALSSKTDTAMMNEALIKCLCYNLAVLNYQMHAMRIKPMFWQKKAA